jgi:hypothetical protein
VRVCVQSLREAIARAQAGPPGRLLPYLQHDVAGQPRQHAGAPRVAEPAMIMHHRAAAGQPTSQRLQGGCTCGRTSSRWICGCPHRCR